MSDVDKKEYVDPAKAPPSDSPDDVNHEIESE